MSSPTIIVDHRLRLQQPELVEALPKITSPGLLFVSPQDHVVETISLLDSFHVATLDHDAQLINLESVRFALRSVER